MKGSFSEESLSQYAELAAQSKTLEFSETDVYDFTRCVRPNGTAYGTNGKCRKGTEQAKEAEPQKVVTKLKVKAPKNKVELGTKEQYAALMKRQQELVQKGDMAGAMKLTEKIKAAAEKAKDTPEEKTAAAQLKKNAEDRVKEEANFEAAQKKRNEGQLAANLSAKDKKVIADYTKETMGQSARSYDNMNSCLRFPSTCPDKKTSSQFTKEFDVALAKLPKNEEGNKFYRGVSVRPGQTEQLYKALENAQPGTRMKDPGYGSYSAERRQAEHFTNRNAPNIIFVTRSKSMTPINMHSKIKEENEAILPRGTEQTIRKVTKEGKNLIVELD
jgi:hypothetical protein